jgi:SH3 domain-containing protein
MGSPRRLANLLCAIFVTSLLFPTCPASARDKKDALQYGMGLVVNVPAGEADVLKAVEEVVQNGVIRGTKEYAKDEFVSGATAASDSTLFEPWTDGGKIFYKVRTHVLDPRNFKDGGDVGTLAVRYVVMKQDETHTVLKIDAIFVEDFRRRAHASDGSVESAEYKDIHDHVDALQSMKQQTAEAERERQEAAERKLLPVSSTPQVEVVPQAKPEEKVGPMVDDVSSASPVEDLKKKVHELRSLAERKVKAQGTALRSAPFQTATSLQTLPAGAEVLIVISTPYWFGVETHDGQHGWISRSELEELP